SSTGAQSPNIIANGPVTITYGSSEKSEPDPRQPKARKVDAVSRPREHSETDSKPKQFTPVISSNQSRMAVLDTKLDFTKKSAPFPFFNFFYHNLGKLPAHGVVGTTDLHYAAGELTDDAILQLQDKADLDQGDYFEASKKTKFTEIYPDDRMIH